MRKKNIVGTSGKMLGIKNKRSQLFLIFLEAQDKILSHVRANVIKVLKVITP